MEDSSIFDEKQFQRMYSTLKTECIETEMVLKEARAKMRKSQELAQEAEMLINYAYHQLCSILLESTNMENAETKEEILEVKRNIFERYLNGRDGESTYFKKEE